MQMLGGLVGERHDHDSRGLLVEAVHDEHPVVAPQALLDLRRRARHHRVPLAGNGGVDHQAGRLVDRDDVLVKVEDLDGTCIAAPVTAGQLRTVLNLVAFRNGVSRVDDDVSVDRHVANLDLVPRPGVARAQENLRNAAQTPLLVHGLTVPCASENEKGSRWTRGGREAASAPPPRRSAVP